MDMQSSAPRVLRHSHCNKQGKNPSEDASYADLLHHRRSVVKETHDCCLIEQRGIGSREKMCGQEGGGSAGWHRAEACVLARSSGEKEQTMLGWGVELVRTGNGKTS